MIRLKLFAVALIWFFSGCFLFNKEFHLKMECAQPDSILVVVNHTFQVDFSYTTDSLKIDDKNVMAEFKNIFEQSERGIRNEKSKIAFVEIFIFCEDNTQCFIAYIGLSHYARILQHTGCNKGAALGNYKSYEMGKYLLGLFEDNSIKIQME